MAAAHPALDEAFAAHARLDYEAIPPLLEEVLRTSTDADERIRAYELSATVAVTFDRISEAEAAYLEILALRPDYRLDDRVSPKLRAAFATARARRAVAEPIVAVPPSPPVAPTEGPGTALAAASSPPLYARWWLWTAIAVAAGVGAGIGIWAVSSPRLPETDYGPYRL
jgi:hypothetical protein